MRSGDAQRPTAHPWRLRYGLLLGWLLLAALRGAAQGGGGPLIERVDMLPDRGYAWPQVLRDPALAFAPADSVRPAQARRFWLRVALHNPSRYTQDVELRVRPGLDNTLYYFQQDARRWRTHRAGEALGTDRQRTKGRLPLRLPAQARTTCYVLLRLDSRATLPPAARLQVRLEPAATVRQTDQFFFAAWLVAVAVLAVLLLTNLQAYARSRDRATGYYVCAQVGALCYITAFRGYVQVLCPTPALSQRVLPNGFSYAYTLSDVVMHLSVALLLLGLVQMTRAYLPLRARLPRLDAALRWALRVYLGFTLVVGLVNGNGFYLDHYSLLPDNLLVLAVLGLLLGTVVAAVRQQLPLARPYLLAQVLPLLCVLAVAGYHVLAGFDNNDDLLLPDLAIVSHALGFSAALSQRLHTLQLTLLATERAAAALALDIQAQELRHRELVLQNGHIQAALQRHHQASAEQARQRSAEQQEQRATSQQLQQQLESNQRELASTMLYVEQKNVLLAELKNRIQELGRQRPGQQKELAGIRSLLTSHDYLDEDWGRFKVHFEQVHPHFFAELQARYPGLTPHEQRLASYFHIQLSAKEIAALLNIDPASVRRAKTRLYKKMAAADQATGRPAADGAAESPAAA